MLTIVSCSSAKLQISEKKPPTTQIVLFHFSYFNAAWGYQNRGWFVNNHGLVKAYRVTDMNLWHDPAQSGPDSGYISEKDLLADYKLADKVVFEFSHFILSKRIKQIGDAAKGELSTPTRTAYDAGRRKYSAYYFDQNKRMYKEVVLSISGDLSQTNLSSTADTLNGWLGDLDPIYEDSLRAWTP